jgi:hypothetical protein
MVFLYLFVIFSDFFFELLDMILYFSGSSRDKITNAKKIEGRQNVLKNNRVRINRDT